MASGDTLLILKANAADTPSSAGATHGSRNNQSVLKFPDDSTTSAYWGSLYLPDHYDGGGITARIEFASDTATSLGVRLDGYFERRVAGTYDSDADGWQTTPQSVSPAHVTAAGLCENDDIDFSNSQIDGLLKNEFFRFRLSRDHDHADDDMSGDLLIFAIALLEQ